MSKGLKALQDLYDTLPLVLTETNCNKYLEIIEKELKEYEKMKSIKGTTTLDSALEETLIKACPNVAKKLKALEIIKEKKVNVGNLIHHITDKHLLGLESYNFMWGGTPEWQLTKDEYELLKELLL